MIIIQLDNPGKCYTLDLDTYDLDQVTREEWLAVSGELHASTVITVTEDAPATVIGPVELRLVVLLYDDEAGIATGYFLDHRATPRYFSAQSVPTLDLDDVNLKQTIHIGAQWAREMGCNTILLYRPERRNNPLRVLDASDILGGVWNSTAEVSRIEY